MAVIKMNFLSQEMGMQTNITVFLPTFSYDDRDAKRFDVYKPGVKYQTLWLLHGGFGDDSDYLNFTSIVRYADLNKVAVIMPPDFNAMYCDNPKGAHYYTFIVKELPEMLRAIFPLSDKREDNFIAGLSMGASGTFKCAVAHPEMYCAAMCMSGGGRGPFASRPDAPDRSPEPIFADAPKDGENDPWNYITQQVAAGKQMPKFFFTCGSADPLAYKDYLTTSAKVKELGCDVFTEEVPGYKHEWDFWDLSLRKALNEWLPLRRSIIMPE